MHVGALLDDAARYFDAAEALRMIEEERITFAYPTFPAITQDLIHHPDFDSTDLGTDPARQRHRAARGPLRGSCRRSSRRRRS